MKGPAFNTDELKNALEALAKKAKASIEAVNNETIFSNPEIIKKSLEEAVKKVLQAFIPKLMEILTELNDCQQNAEKYSIDTSDLSAHSFKVNAAKKYIDAILENEASLSSFCANFNQEKINELLQKINENVDSKKISTAINAANKGVNNVGLDLLEQINQKKKEFAEKLEAIQALSPYIEGVEEFVNEANPKFTNTPGKPLEQIIELSKIDFSKYDEALKKFNAEKKEFESEELKAFKELLERLKSNASPELAAQIDEMLKSFKIPNTTEKITLEAYKKAEVTLFTPVKSVLNAFVANQANILEELKPLHYAIETSQLSELHELTTQLNAIKELTPDKLAKAFEVHKLASKIKLDLKGKKLLDETAQNINLDTTLDSQKKTDAIAELTEISEAIIKAKGSDKPDIEDLRLRCVGLQKKYGALEAHQREIAIARSALIRTKNEAVFADTEKSQSARDEIVKKLEDDAKYYTSLFDEDWRPTTQKGKERQFSDARKKVFNDISRTERDKLIGQREAIIKELEKNSSNFDALQAVRNIQPTPSWIHFIKKAKAYTLEKEKTDYQTSFQTVITKLKTIDTKLLGKKRANVFYANLLDKKTLLLGGTQLVIPKYLIDLQETLVAANSALSR